MRKKKRKRIKTKKQCFSECDAVVGVRRIKQFQEKLLRRYSFLLEKTEYPNQTQTQPEQQYSRPEASTAAAFPALLPAVLYGRSWPVRVRRAASRPQCAAGGVTLRVSVACGIPQVVRHYFISDVVQPLNAPALVPSLCSTQHRCSR